MTGERKGYTFMGTRATTADRVKAGATLIAAAVQPGGKTVLHLALEHERAAIQLHAVSGDRMPVLMHIWRWVTRR